MSSNNFWQEFAFPSPVDDILKKPNFTLEELLDEDDVVVDIRSQKDDLKDYLMRRESLVALLSYVVDDAAEDASAETKFRYPVVATEILTSEVDEIERELVNPNLDYLPKLFGFFQKEKVNHLLGNLVLRIINCLFSSRLTSMIEYMRAHPEIITSLVSHLDCTAVPEFLARIIINLEGEYEGRGTLAWLVDNGVPTMMVERFSPEYKHLQSDLARTLIEVILSSSSNSPFLKQLYEPEMIDLLFSQVLKEGNVYGFRSGMAVMSQLLRGLAHQDDGDVIPHDATYESLPIIIHKVIDKLPQLFSLLTNPPNATTATNQMGDEIKVFGFFRLAILQCFESLLGLSLPNLTRKILVEHVNLFGTILQLLFDFPTNNFCPMFVEKILGIGLGQASDEEVIEFVNGSGIVTSILLHSSLIKDNKFMARPFLHRIIFTVHERQRRTPQLDAVLSVVEGWEELLGSLAEEFASMDNSIYPYPGGESPGQPEQMSSESPEISNDADDYDTEQAEVLLTKEDIELLF